MILVKSIVQSTGRSMTSIKNDLDKCGDLGIVAEESRGSQQIMFKPSPLTLRAVFKKLREIADLKGLYMPLCTVKLRLQVNLAFPKVITIYFFPSAHRAFQHE